MRFGVPVLIVVVGLGAVGWDWSCRYQVEPLSPKQEAEIAAEFRKLGLDLDRPEPHPAGPPVDPAEYDRILEGYGIEPRRPSDPGSWLEQLRARAGSILASAGACY